MAILFIFFVGLIGITIGSILIFSYSDISEYAWGHRIRKITFKNGESRYYIQQRIPFVIFPIWFNCVYMIGLETYVDRWYSTEKEAQEFLEIFEKSLEDERKYKIRSKETIKRRKVK